MMEKIIKIQLNNNFQEGKEYVETYFQWTDEMQLIAKKRQSVSKPILNAKIESELADELLKEN